MQRSACTTPLLLVTLPMQLIIWCAGTAWFNLFSFAFIHIKPTANTTGLAEISQDDRVFAGTAGKQLELL